MTETDRSQPEPAIGGSKGCFTRLAFALGLIGTVLGALNASWSFIYGIEASRTERERYLQECFRTGQAALRNDDLGEAEHQLVLAEKTDEEHEKTLLLQALLHYAKGRRTSAISLAEQVRSDHPDSSQARRLLGEFYLASGDHSTAKERLQEALKLEPDDPNVLNTLGLVSLAQGDLAAAEHIFVDILKSLPTDRKALANLCLVLAQTDVQKGLEACERAVRVDRKNSVLLGNLALLHYMLGHFDRAEALLLQAKNLNPQDYWVDDLLSLVARAQGKGAEAVERLHSADYLKELYRP